MVTPRTNNNCNYNDFHHKISLQSTAITSLDHASLDDNQISSMARQRALTVYRWTNS